MSIKLNLGAWNSVFAVPSKVVDEGLKFSDGVKLKVLLFVLRNCDNDIDENTISQATGVNVTDIPEALEYWVQRGILQKDNNIFSPTQESKPETYNDYSPDKGNEDFESILPVTDYNSKLEKNINSDKAFNSNKENLSNSKNQNTVEAITQRVAAESKRFAVTKPQKPDYQFTAQQLATDSEFKVLAEEAQSILGKTLSNSDCSTLLMLKNTCGLPLDVILMLIQYCVSIEKANIRTIEKIGISWADDGIYSVEAADNKIRLNKQLNTYFSIVSSAFGLQNIGSPTKKQLEYSKRWIEDWKFSPEMLREAYERCVDKKGTVQFSYIDGILKRWNSANISTLSDLKSFESKPGKPTGKSKASYDIEELDKINILGN